MLDCQTGVIVSDAPTRQGKVKELQDFWNVYKDSRQRVVVNTKEPYITFPVRQMTAIKSQLREYNDELRGDQARKERESGIDDN